MVVNVFIGIMKIVFKKEDCDIKKLNSILFFYLLFWGMINVFVSKDLEFFDKFDFCFGLFLCLRYEKYLK